MRGQLPCPEDCGPPTRAESLIRQDLDLREAHSEIPREGPPILLSTRPWRAA